MGSIFDYPTGGNYDEYFNKFIKRKAIQPVVKVWTGR
jgi:hypothetical protein